MSDGLDLSILLAPIPGDMPSGANLRDVASAANRAVYDQIRGARQSARKKEMSSPDPIAAGSRDDWQSVFNTAASALATRSKDLEIATYLVESSVRVQEFSGLRDSLSVFREIMDQYWDVLYPQLDPENPAGRVGPLGALNGDGDKEGSLRYGIARVPLTDGNNERFGLFHYECGVAMETLSPAQQETRLKSGWISLAMFDESARKTPLQFLDNSLRLLRQCAEELDKLKASMAGRFGHEAPPIGKIRAAVESCIEIVERHWSTKSNAAQAMADAGEGQTQGVAAGGYVGSVPGTFRTREEAFDVVASVADFFRKTEPQSPVIFVLEQAVRWGKMPLPELLMEWVADDMTRGQIFKLVGIRPPADGQQMQIGIAIGRAKDVLFGERPSSFGAEKCARRRVINEKAYRDGMRLFLNLR